jgi:hypothetical protein
VKRKIDINRFRCQWIYWQININLGEISGSHGGEHEVTVFLAYAQCSLVEVYRRFRGASCLIALMMEAASTSKTSVNFDQTTRRNIP